MLANLKDSSIRPTPALFLTLCSGLESCFDIKRDLHSRVTPPVIPESPINLTDAGRGYSRLLVSSAESDAHFWSLASRVSDILGRVHPRPVATQYFLILTGAVADIPLLKQQPGSKLLGGPRP